MNVFRTWLLVSAILFIALIAVGVSSVAQYQAASTAQAKLDCATPWLEKTVNLHDLHLKDQTTTTEESQLELMDQIMNAYSCVTGEKVPEMSH